MVTDPTGRLSGRGAYVCVETDCLTNAITKGALRRALEIPLPPAFLESVGMGATTMNDTTRGGLRGQK